MRTTAFRQRGEEDVCCKGCGALLAKIDGSGLTIRRGDLQATVVGQFHVSLVCYRPHCRTLNVLEVITRAEGGAAT